MSIQVKPLEWHDCTDGTSHDDGCQYEIERDGKFWRIIRGVTGGTAYLMHCATLEAAKAAAQADYEARIRSALLPAPAVPDDVAGTLARIIPILDHAFASRDHLILNCALGQITLGDVMDLRATIEAQAAELARIRSLADALVNHPGWGTVNYTDGDMWSDADNLRAAIAHTAAQPAPDAVAEALCRELRQRGYLVPRSVMDDALAARARKEGQ